MTGNMQHSFDLVLVKKNSRSTYRPDFLGLFFTNWSSSLFGHGATTKQGNILRCIKNITCEETISFLTDLINMLFWKGTGFIAKICHFYMLFPWRLVENKSNCIFRT